MNKIDIFKSLHLSVQKRNEYIDSIPQDIQSAIFDNEYVNQISQDNSNLLKMVFGEHTDAIEWFLYEWKPGAAVGFGEYTEYIMDIDQYIDFMKRFEAFTE